MKTYTQVSALIANWKLSGMSKSNLIRYLAEACLGWPYVWGGYGQFCSPENRRAYADRGACSSAEAEQIRKKCPVLSGKQSACAGCKYYPGGRVRFFDCRGFTRWLLQQAGLSLRGAGATSQWNDETNWAEKGPVSDLPPEKVCCLFMRQGTKMSHTGMHLGNGVLIHCSGEVKRGKVTDKGWTHYAIPKGLAEEAPTPPAPQPDPAPAPAPLRRLLRKGCRGEDVKELQSALIVLGYDLGKCGADGIFGRKTQAAVKAFQKDEGIQVDGIAGPVTYSRLYPEGGAL